MKLSASFLALDLSKGLGDLARLSEVGEFCAFGPRPRTAAIAAVLPSDSIHIQIRRNGMEWSYHTMNVYLLYHISIVVGCLPLNVIVWGS